MVQKEHVFIPNNDVTAAAAAVAAVAAQEFRTVSCWDV
jgi:hypothetical protein